MRTPTLELLSCLNGWPKGTIGWRLENEVISNLLELCLKYGADRVCAIAPEIEKFWRKQLHMLKQPMETDLDFLRENFPKGTNSWETEGEIISKLLSLCKENGFGRVPQLVSEIEEIWLDPEKNIPKWKKFREERLKMFGERSF